MTVLLLRGALLYWNWVRCSAIGRNRRRDPVWREGTVTGRGGGVWEGERGGGVGEQERGGGVGEGEGGGGVGEGERVRRYGSVVWLWSR